MDKRIRALLRLVAALGFLMVTGCVGEVTSNVGSSEQGIVMDPDWLNRMSGDRGVHLVSLPSSLGSYMDAWVYQMGSNYLTWKANGGRTRHNNDCGPACVQMVRRLTGWDSVDCTYQDSVSGCERFPNVHSLCRAEGVCGAIHGYTPSSWNGNDIGRVGNVLDALGFRTQLYGDSIGLPITLTAIKNAVLNDHPVITAISPVDLAPERTYARGSGVDSHFVLVVGFGPSCDSSVRASGYIYYLEPGWASSSHLVCVSEDRFNIAMDREGSLNRRSSDHSAIEITRPGFDHFPNASWYPPGTILQADDSSGGMEYYYVGLIAGALRLRHASRDALIANRLAPERAIHVTRDVLACFQFGPDLDTAPHFYEYRNGSTIYLVDTARRERVAFLNDAAYASHNGSEGWMRTTGSQVLEWRTYPLVGTLGLAPGMLVMYEGFSDPTVWVVSFNERGRYRLPIADEQAARVFGYDISAIGSNPRVSVRLSASIMEATAGPVGQLLTEEMGRDCDASRCLPGGTCLAAAIEAGGSDEGDAVGNGACVGTDCDPISSDAGTPDASVPPPICPPGNRISCACVDGRMGTQVCVEDGSRYGPCESPVPPPPPPPPPPTCAPGLVLCGTRCIDISVDATNCGGCGHACGTTERCESGTCLPLVMCAPPARLCGDACVDVRSDIHNCGDCGHTCIGGGVCTGGACVIPCLPPFTSCGSLCTNLSTDNANCGACGNPCPSGTVCSGGSCATVCSWPTAACGSACVDLQSDGRNCGACGNACASGLTCVSGACRLVCPSSEIVCGSTCVDPQTNSANCGGCGRTCGTGSTCTGGICQYMISCTPPASLCGTQCVYLSSDTNNCGSCGHVCPSGTVCTSSSCVASTYCSPNTSRPCVCLDGTSGAQTCDRTGSGYSYCLSNALPHLTIRANAAAFPACTAPAEPAPDGTWPQGWVIRVFGPDGRPHDSRPGTFTFDEPINNSWVGGIVFLLRCGYDSSGEYNFAPWVGHSAAEVGITSIQITGMPELAGLTSICPPSSVVAFTSKPLIPTTILPRQCL